MLRAIKGHVRTLQWVSPVVVAPTQMMLTLKSWGFVPLPMATVPTSRHPLNGAALVAWKWPQYTSAYALVASVLFPLCGRTAEPELVFGLARKFPAAFNDYVHGRAIIFNPFRSFR